MQRPNKAWVALALVYFVAPCVTAQTNGECKDRTVLATALDAQRRPVKSLAAPDFAASYGGRPLIPASAQYRENPHARVRVLLDVSKSMNDALSHKWKIAHAVASEFVSSAPAGMEVSFMSFSSVVHEKFEASDGRQPIQEWLASAPVRKGSTVDGRTALLETIETAIHELSPAQPGDAIYVITDGGDNASKTSSSQVERSLQESGIRLFAFILPDPFSSQMERLGSLNLNDIVRRSGGLLADLDRPPVDVGTEHDIDDKTSSAIRDATRTITTQMTNFYVLTLAGSVSTPKPKDLNLKLVDAQGHKKKNLILAYTRWPINCPQ
jgi:hypothetical protein